MSLRLPFAELLNIRISKFLENFGYVKVFNKDRVLKGVTDADALQALVFNALMVGIDMNSPIKAEHLQDISRGVAFNFKKLKSLSLKEFLKTVEQPIMLNRQITFAIGAGVASYWELQVKLLAQHIGIDIYDKQNRGNTKSPSIKDIEPIIDDIKKQLPKIDFKFGRLTNLRNAVVHGNFHQIRTVASESQRKEVKNSFKGNVMMVNIGNISDSIFMGEEKEFERIKDLGLFSWFLETGNSALFETVIQEFQESCYLLNAVVHLKSLSFEETASIYENVCVKGQKLAEHERSNFLISRKLFNKPEGLLEKQLTTIEKVLRN